MTTPTAPTYRLDWWGEDSDRIGCKGHVDLEEFRAMAVEMIRADIDAEPDFSNAPQHIWLRPLTVGYARRVYKVTKKRARELVASGEHEEPCGPDDDGAQPYTVLDID